MLAILLFVSRWLVFWGDEWNQVFLGELSVEAVLSPIVDAIIASTTLVYQLLLAVVGLRSYLPYLVVEWAAHLVCVALLYRIVGRRSGSVVGLVAALSLLFLGSAFEVLLHPFQMQYLFAAIGGLVAVDVLDEPTGRRVILAAIALVVAVASSSLGVIFLGVILVWAILRRAPELVVACVPATMLYAGWYLTWGTERQHFPPMGSVDVVLATLHGIGAVVVGILGLPPARFAPVGAAIAVLVVAALAYAALRGWRPDPLAIAGVSGVVAQYGLQSIFRGNFGVEHAARSGYLYPAAIFVWLAIAGIVGRRLANPPRRTVAAIAVVTLIAIAGNMRQFAGAAVGERQIRATEIAELRLIEELAADRTLVDAQPPGIEGAGIFPSSYLRAIARYGHPDVGFDWRAEADQAAVAAYRRALLGE